jgi:hypothetical protein
MYFTMQTVEICTKKLKTKGEIQKCNHQTIQNPTHKNLCRGNVDFTYYSVTLPPPWNKTKTTMKIRNNKEEHIRPTQSSLLLTSFLIKGIHAEKFFNMDCTLDL